MLQYGILVNTVKLYFRFRVIFNQTCSSLWQYLLYFQFLVIFQPDMSIVVANFILNFGQVHQVNFHRCQFSVMFTDFGHIDSVMLTTLVMSYGQYFLTFLQF